MNIRLDVHTHTIASGHAFSTLQEMAQSLHLRRNFAPFMGQSMLCASRPLLTDCCI